MKDFMNNMHIKNSVTLIFISQGEYAKKCDHQNRIFMNAKYAKNDWPILPR